MAPACRGDGLQLELAAADGPTSAEEGHRAGDVEVAGCVGVVLSAGRAEGGVDAGADSIYLDKPSFPYGGAGLVSTARDYDRLLRMLAGNGRLGAVRILSEKTARLARTNLLPANVALLNFGPVPRDQAAGMGAGGFVTTVDVDSFGRHRGTFGWDGAAGTRAWTDPVTRVRATMMINGTSRPNVGEEFDKAVTADLAARRAGE